MSLEGTRVWIEELRITNFLSFRDATIELGKLNILIGPNNAGKSNLARAAQLIASTARSGIPSLSGYRGFREIVYGFDATKEILLSLKLRIGGRGVTYELTLTHDNYFEKVLIDGELALEDQGSRPDVKVLTNSGVITFHKPGGLASSNLYKSKYRVAITHLPHNAIEELHTLFSVLNGIGVYSFTPERLRARTHIESPPALGYFGDNLARVLLHLYLEERKVFSMVEGVIRGLVPDVEEIIPHIEGSNVEIWLRVRGLREPLRPHNISDGTLRMMAYVTALHSCRGLVVFEEPENCIHPHLLESLVDLARNSPCQVVITTHSLYLLDHVEPSEVYIVDKMGTESVIRRLSDLREISAVRKYLEEGGTLGEAWYSGIMGGVPKPES